MLCVQLIRQIDSAPDRLKALEMAMAKNKDFASFLDDMLLTLGVCTRTPDGLVQFVGVPTAVKSA